MPSFPFWFLCCTVHTMSWKLCGIRHSAPWRPSGVCSSAFRAPVNISLSSVRVHLLFSLSLSVHVLSVVVSVCLCLCSVLSLCRPVPFCMCVFFVSVRGMLRTHQPGDDFAGNLMESRSFAAVHQLLPVFQTPGMSLFEGEDATREVCGTKFFFLPFGWLSLTLRFSGTDGHSRTLFHHNISVAAKV